MTPMKRGARIAITVNAFSAGLIALLWGFKMEPRTGVGIFGCLIMLTSYYYAIFDWGRRDS